MYVGEGYVPHQLKYAQYSHCAATRSIQIRWETTSPDPLIIAVHSSEGCSQSTYKIRKFESLSSPSSNAHVDNSRFPTTSKITSKLQLLATNSEEDLLLKFPALENAAANAVAKGAQLRVSGNLLGDRSQLIDPSKEAMNRDNVALEDYVLKIGRQALRKESKTRRGEAFDPNLHVDLFPRIQVHHNASNETQNTVD